MSTNNELFFSLSHVKNVAIPHLSKTGRVEQRRNFNLFILFRILFKYYKLTVSFGECFKYSLNIPDILLYLNIVKNI